MTDHGSPEPARPGLHHRRGHDHATAPFGADGFGRRAEAFARFFGTPTFLIGQTVVVIVWIVVNAVAAGLRFDPYPFILLNLAFSTQAAYAAPLILLAQTRQADRDKLQAEADVAHRDELGRSQERQLEAIERVLARNTELTGQLDRLLAGRAASPGPGSEAGGAAET